MKVLFWCNKKVCGFFLRLSYVVSDIAIYSQLYINQCFLYVLPDLRYIYIKKIKFSVKLQKKLFYSDIYLLFN